MKAESNQAVSFLPTRIYDESGKADGYAWLKIRFGPSPETAQTELVMRYTFKVTAPPDVEGAERKVPFKLISEIVEYLEVDKPNQA